MSAADQDLAEHLEGDEPDYDAQPEAPQDADEIDRRLRRLTRVRDDMDDANAAAAAQMDQVQEWLDARIQILANKEQWLVDGLEMWHRAVLADDPSLKTISLPCGTLHARKQQPLWEFDEPTFLAWAAEHAPELVRVPEPKPAPDKAAAKKALITQIEGASPGDPRPAVTLEGEVVPGVTVTVRPPSFSIDTDGGA